MFRGAVFQVTIRTPGLFSNMRRFREGGNRADRSVWVSGWPMVSGISVNCRVSCETGQVGDARTPSFKYRGL
jgi:hypothetical protein